MYERVGQLVGQVQQELWQQLNAESMSAMSGEWGVGAAEGAGRGLGPQP